MHYIMAAINNFNLKMIILRKVSYHFKTMVLPVFTLTTGEELLNSFFSPSPSNCG